MKHETKPWIVILGALVACGAEPLTAETDPSTGAGGAAPSVTAGNGGESIANGGNGGSPNDLSNAADEVQALLSGRFDSSEQAQADPSYFDVSLVTCPVNAPELGERVLYVEQALSSKLQQPYRQRLYVITEGAEANSQASSRVFSLLAPTGFIGLCDQQSVRTVSAAEASERTGCVVHLQRVAEHFEGSTSAKDCESSLQGASYATSEVTLHSEHIDSWDRGFTANDQQVWGAVAGPYRFNRKAP